MLGEAERTLRKINMKRIVFALVGIGALAGTIATTAPVSGQSDGEAAPIYGVKIP